MCYVSMRVILMAWRGAFKMRLRTLIGDEECRVPKRHAYAQSLIHLDRYVDPLNLKACIHLPML